MSAPAGDLLPISGTLSLTLTLTATMTLTRYLDLDHDHDLDHDQLLQGINTVSPQGYKDRLAKSAEYGLLTVGPRHRGSLIGIPATQRRGPSERGVLGPYRWGSKR